jgi:electron transport complex protein RnfB
MMQRKSRSFALSVRALDRALPQTQCTRCGYPRCRDYARALVRGEADINRCPPGGDETISILAGLTGHAPPGLDPECGVHEQRRVATIDEPRCIGCTKCIQVCPVDAILGSAKLMHTVLAAECTGCELCVPACPVDCIDMANDISRPPGERWREYNELDVSRARHRTAARLRRLARIRRERTRRSRLRRRASASAMVAPDAQQIRAEIRAAVARARARRGPRP